VTFIGGNMIIINAVAQLLLYRHHLSFLILHINNNESIL